MKKILMLVICFIVFIGCSENPDLNINNDSSVKENIVTVESNNIEEVSNEQVVEETKTHKIVIGVENLNVRKSSSTSSEVIEMIHMGDVFEVLSEEVVENELWYQIQLNENKGWIAGWLTIDADEKLSDYHYLYDHFDDKNIIGFISKSDDIGSLKCVEVIEGKTWLWFDKEESYIVVEAMDKISFNVSDEIIIRTSANEIVIKTNSRDTVIECSDDGKYSLINLQEKALIFDNVHNLVAVEDRELDYFDTVYRTHYKTNICDISLGDEYVQIIDTLENINQTEFSEGIYNSMAYMISPNNIVALSNEEIEVLPTDRTVSLMSSLPYELAESRVLVDRVDILKYTPEYVVNFIDGHSADRYYYFDEKEYKGYIRITETLDVKKGTMIIDKAGNQYVIDGNLRLYDSSLIQKGFGIFRDKENQYFVNISTGNRIKVEKFYISPDFNYLVVVQNNSLKLLSLSSGLDQVLDELDFDHEIYKYEWEANNLALSVRGIYSSNGYLQRDLEKVILEIENNELNIVRDSQVYKVYDGPNINSEVIGEITVNELKETEVETYLVLDNGLLKFCGQYSEGYVFEDYNYENDDSYIGSKMSAYLYDDIMTNDGTVLKDERGYSLRYQYKDIEDEGYVFLYSDSRFYEEDYYYYLYDLNKSSLIKAVNFEYYIKELDLLVERKHIESGVFNIKFQQLSDDGVKLLGEQLINGRGDLDLHWSGEVLSMNVKSYKGNDWINANYYGTNHYSYKFIDGKIVNDDVSKFMEEEVTLYSSLGNLDETVKKVYVSNRNDITFLDTYQIIEDQAQLWFEIELDEKLYYIHRPFRENEYTSYDYSNKLYDIILEDGTIVEQDVIIDCSYYYIKDDLGSLGYLSTYFSWEEGAFGRLLNMRTGEEFYSVREVHLSPDKKHFFSYDGGYIQASLEFAIYSINDESIEELLYVRYGSWLVKEYEWVNNTKLEIVIENEETHLEGLIIVESVDGVWTYKDDLTYEN